MLYKDFVREKSHHLTKIKSAEGYPCVFDKSKGKALKNYKVYGNSVQDGTPTPESPIEIQSVGELSATNLLDVKEYFSDFLDEDGNMVFNQSNFTSITKLLLTDEFKENTQYTLSCTVEISNADNNGLRFLFYDSSDTVLSEFKCVATGSTTFKVKITNNANTTIKYARIIYVTSTKRCDVKISNFKIEEGTVSTGHIPDGKYGIPVLVRGENIFGGTVFRDKLIELGGTLDVTNKTVTVSASQLNNKVLFDKFDADKRYTFIFRGYNTNTSAPTHNTNTKIVYSDDTFDNVIFNSKAGTKGTLYYKSTENKSIKHLIGTWHTSSTVFYYEECGIFEGTISLDEFEPYQEMQTNIFLDAPLQRINVTEGNKKGDYGDYIDFKRGIVVRNTIKKIFDGTETWGTVNDYTIYYAIWNGDVCNALCTHSPVIAGRYGVNWYIGATSYSNGGVMFMWNHGGTMTIDEWKSQLAQWYDEGNPLTVVCPMTTPIEKAIELPPILTLKDNNIITTTTTVTPSKIEVKYIAK